MALLAAGRRGAAAAGPPCGGSLRPGPRSVPRLPRARPLRGSAPGRTRWGAWAAPAVGGGPLPPARAPGGAARGPLLGGRGSLCRPPVGPAPTRGGAARHSPLGGPWAVPRGGAPAAPPPARGGSGLFRAGPVRCLVLLPLALPPAALAPSPSRPPPPPGAGERKRLTPAAAGTGGAPLPQRTKKSLPACGSRHPRKGTNDVFCSIFHLPAKPPSLTGLLKISRPDHSRSDGGTRRNARRISGPDIKTAAFGKASPKSMEMG